MKIPFAHGVARVVELAELESNAAWPAAFAAKSKDHRFYEIVERTINPEFQHRYLVFEDLEGRTRAVQPVFFVQQNLVEGIPGQLREIIDLLRRRFPRLLTMRMLMVGCAAGEGHLGACAPEDESWLAQALAETLRAYAKQSRVSLVVLKDFPARYRSALAALTANGYARIPSMPMTQLALKHESFEAFLNTLGKATRKDLRRKFRKTDGGAVSLALQVVEDVTPFVDEIYPLYLQVHERSSLKFERLTKEYFCALSQRMPDRTRFFIWRLHGKAVAFSLCMVHGGAIYDDYLGLDYAVALDLHLYFYTFRDIISWAIEQRLDWYYSSPLNYKPKLHLGCDLRPLDLYVMHTASLLNPIFQKALHFLGPTRHDPVLRQFRNAAELQG